ncbi:hypothetical protein [Curtobacterium sp. MCBA15_012]|uniref:hypothetical protein n=1 Tax=Curtobacterium sp. MCBA15_012 TaxID=1898738 RepID=UPI0008DCD982|nr:hypothetical protein [Curtobacterium sp. MCBA15_012]WIA99609.1 hypothetical protein QOL15_13950 [Curtobacterium sp. MCBA15_012]
MGRRTVTASIALAGVSALLLTGCSVFGDDAPLPKPTGHAAPSASARPDGGVDGDGAGGDAEQVSTKQAVPAGTVVAETDAVSKSGDTAVHVRIVADDAGTFDAQLSGYRTTNPQPMSIEFRRSVATPGEGFDADSVASTTWQADAPAPDSVSLSDAGAYPDWLHSVVLVPAATTQVPADSDDADESLDADRPWVGTVLAAAELHWRIPSPFPDLRPRAGAARPGAYGWVFDAAGDKLAAPGGAVPTAYRVSHGDDQTTVAKRLGLTLPQLRWLNPTMHVRGNGWLYEDTDLNLDPAAR